MIRSDGTQHRVYLKRKLVHSRCPRVVRTQSTRIQRAATCSWIKFFSTTLGSLALGRMDSGLGGLRLRLTSPSKSSARPRQNSQESHFADSKLRVMRAALKEIESRHPARDVLEELRLPGAE